MTTITLSEIIQTIIAGLLTGGAGAFTLLMLCDCLHLDDDGEF